MWANTDRHCHRNHQELTPERALSLLLYLIYVLEEFLGISIYLDSSNSLDGPTNRTEPIPIPIMHYICILCIIDIYTDL